MKTFLSCCAAAALLVAGAQVYANDTTTPSSGSTTATKEARQAKMMKECIAKQETDNASSTASEREQKCTAEVNAKMNAEPTPR